MWPKEEWGGKWTTERKWSLAFVSVYEYAVWAGEGETNIGIGDLKSKKCIGKQLLRMRPGFLDQINYVPGHEDKLPTKSLAG